MRTYSVRQAAKLIGVHHITLHHWVHTGVVKPSIALRIGGRTIWGFTDRDVLKARKVKATRKPGPKSREKEGQATGTWKPRCSSSA